jgi:methyl-accepting chemotaxis protein
MSLSLLFPACAILFAGYFLQHTRHAHAQAALRRKQGMADVVMLRRILELMPQHRGMANALLQGDESFRSKLGQLQGEIDGVMRPLAALSAGADPWSVAARVARIQDGWSLIKQQLASFAPAESFARHTSLITEILYLINDVADAAGLLGGDADARLIDAAVNQLPMVTETLGQARGMGTGVAARGKCTPDMRVKLRYLLDNTRQVSADVAQGMRATLQSDASLKARAETALEDSQRATQAFLTLLETRIINARVDIEPTEYYAAGTEAIQHSFALLDAINNALMTRLQTRAQQTQKQLWWARGAAVLLLLPAGYLFSLLV